MRADLPEGGLAAASIEEHDPNIFENLNADNGWVTHDMITTHES